jgi:hypothetical protein
MMSEELSVGCQSQFSFSKLQTHCILGYFGPGVLALRIFALYSFNKRVITIVIAAAMIGLSVAAVRSSLSFLHNAVSDTVEYRDREPSHKDDV